jgi:Icc-related predicted phosphoesterase
LICNIHGHCHEGSALDKIGNVKIINPGSLMFGEFGELELKERADGSWQVS